MILPLFKTHYSIGKSILTLSKPSVAARNGSAGAHNDVKKELNSSITPSSIEEIFEDGYDLDKFYLVEDSLIGFLEADKLCDKWEKQLIFGLRINATNIISEDKKENQKCFHKIIIFAKNGEGCKLINKIYSKAFCENDGVIDFPSLKKMWDDDLVLMAIPFYDSFIAKNTLHFCNCVPDFSFCEPTFFVEKNYLPFEHLILEKIEEYCKTFNFKIQDVKSIFYKDRDDFAAYQTYKCICNRRFGRTLSTPNFDHLGSQEFCWESFLEEVKK